MALPPLQEVCLPCRSARRDVTHYCVGEALNEAMLRTRSANMKVEVAEWEARHPGEQAPPGGWGGPTGFMCACEVCHPPVVNDDSYDIA